MKCFFLLLTISASSQPGYQVKKISVSEGLSNGKIYDIATDTLGYMWFATSNGLTRYSGLAFKSYALPDQIRALDPTVVNLHEYRGSLLALLQGGALLQYNYAQDAWDQIASFPDESATTITTMAEGKMLIATVSGFFVYDLESGVSSKKFFPEYRYIRRVEKLGDRLILSTSNGLVTLSAPQDDQFSVRSTQLQGIDVLDFELDENNTIWVGTDAKGLFRIENGAVTPIPILGNEAVSVRDISINPEGSVLIAVDKEGFFALDNFGKVKNRISFDPDEVNTLSQNSVNRIFIDQDDVIWLGIGEIGLNVLYPATKRFQHIVHERYGENTIQNQIIRSVYQDMEGTLWFGTEGGLSTLDKSGNWSNAPVKELEGTPVLTIDQYYGKLILGTYGKGLISYDREDGEVSSYSDAIDLTRVYATYVEGDQLWVGGIDGPVYQIENGEVVSSYSAGQVKAFCSIGDNLMLAGSVEGLQLINSSTQSVTPYTRANQSISKVHDLHYDRRTALIWIANDKGLLSLDFESGTVNVDQGLNEASGAVYSIIEDGNQVFWIAAEKGLFKYDANEGWFRKYQGDDGLLITEFGFGARAKLMDHRLAFGGSKGAVLFNPTDIITDRQSPAIYVADLFVNGSILDEPGFANPNFQEEIKLQFDQNTLQFDFDFVKFHGSSEYQLEWKLEGLDPAFQSAKNKSSVIYRDISPGTYRLLASVYNADGVKSSNSISIPVIILKPYWMQWWAFVLYALFLFMLTYIFISVVRARNDRKLSDEKIKFFVDVAHDIRTPVSLIRLASDQLLQKKNIEESVQIINRYTRNLNEYVTELLDFQKSERNKLRVLVSQFDLVPVLQQIIEDFKPLADQKELQVSLQSLEQVKVWGDKVQLGRVFTNLLSNAIKYNDEKGFVKISIESNEEAIVVLFEDSGFGIPKNQMDKIFTRFHRADNALEQNIRGTGIGLMLSKRIVELHSGTISVVSEQHVGSTFSVSLPLGKQHFDPADIKAEETDQKISRITDSGVLGKRTVLAIEDNEDILDFVRKSLEDDYIVFTATDGKEGLFQVFEQKPDLVITDVMLPNMNGKEICHIIKNDTKTEGIPVILLTALTGMDDKLAGLEVGADFYLEKPFDIDVLKLAVKNLLKRSQLEKELDKDSKVKKTQSPEESFLSNVIDIIHENLTNHDFSIDQLCDEVGLSRSNLFRKMKAIAGISPSDLILEIKLNKAKQLLKSTPNGRIDDIAYQSGFNDPKYFSTLFKKHFKRTPSEFQATFKEPES